MDPNETVPTADPASTEHAIIKPRKATKPRTVTRDLVVLDQLDPKKMTPQECIIYINACREALQGQDAKIKELIKNCESAYEQYKNADAAYKRLKEDADNKLSFAARQAQVAADAIKMQGGTR